MIVDLPVHAVLSVIVCGRDCVCDRVCDRDRVCGRLCAYGRDRDCVCVRVFVTLTPLFFNESLAVSFHLSLLILLQVSPAVTSPMLLLFK